MATCPKPLPDSVRALARQVTLVSVRVVRTETRLLGIKKEDVGAQFNVAQSIRVGVLKSPDVQAGIRAHVTLDCRLAPFSDTERKVAEVKCELALDYIVRDAVLFGNLSDDDLLTFAQSSGLYNAWPYLREFCQTSFARMGLPTQVVLASLPVVDWSGGKKEQEADQPKEPQPSEPH